MSIAYLNECIQKEIRPNSSKLYNNSVFLTKILLEAKFSPKKFKYLEVKELLQKEYPNGNFE